MVVTLSVRLRKVKSPLRSDPVTRAIQAAIPAEAALAGGPLTARVDHLYPAEWAGLERASPKRIADFASGRLYARQALAACGAPPAPLLGDRRRGPAWPPGWIGSVTHTQGYCAALAAPRGAARALGLDVETADPIPPDLRRQISGPMELHAATGALGVEPGLAAKFLFSIKEAAYKAYAPSTGVFLDFPDLSIAVSGSRFQAHLSAAEAPPLYGQRVWHGVFGSVDGFVFAVCHLP
jgi:4'-phosphopantetheinyl transferase EntD